MTLEDFMINRKMTVNGPQAQAYVWYGRVMINDNLAPSPWVKLRVNDIVTLRPFDTEKRKDLEPCVCKYEEEV